MSRLVRHFSLAVVFAAAIISCPAFSEEKSHDLATFFSGRLTAIGKFKNFHDGSTRGVRSDIRRSARWKLVQADSGHDLFGRRETT